MCFRHHISNGEKHSDDTANSSSYHHAYSGYPNTYNYQNHCPDNLVYVVPSDISESNGEPMTKNAGSRWREDETEALVEIWRDKICQTRWWKQSKGVRVNKEMWEEIAQILAERDVFRTPSQCQIRMKNLLQFYRQTVDNRQSEKSMEDLPEYFDIVDRIMSKRDGNFSSLIDDKSGSEDTGEIAENSCDKERKRSYTETKESESGDISVSNKVNIKAETERQNEDPRTHITGEKVRTGDVRHNTFHAYNPGNVIPTYIPTEGFMQSYWNSHKNCCNGEPVNKKSCLGSERERLPRFQEREHLPRFQEINPRYIPMRQNVIRNRFMEAKQNHVCTEACATSACYKSALQHSMHPASKHYSPETDLNSSSLRFIQELLNLQYRQMENFLEIEKKRLEIEEKRLQESRESDDRHSAFLMEAVKILAESFRKVESKEHTQPKSS